MRAPAAEAQAFAGAGSDNSVGHSDMQCFTDAVGPANLGVR